MRVVGGSGQCALGERGAFDLVVENTQIEPEVELEKPEVQPVIQPHVEPEVIEEKPVTPTLIPPKPTKPDKKLLKLKEKKPTKRPDDITYRSYN